MTNLSRLELIEKVRELLINVGFLVSPRSDVYPSSFDVICKRANETLILKVLLNIDSLDKTVAHELRLLGMFLSASPLLIGEQGNAGKLEDDVIYLRHKIPAITLETLRAVLVDGVTPVVYAGPGGFYVELDNKKLQETCEARKMAIGTMARIAGVSRETIRSYETKERCSATIDAAIRIEEYLDESIILPIELFSVPDEKDINANAYTALDNFSELKRSVFLQLHRLGYSVTSMSHSPFSAITESGENEKNNFLIFIGIGEYNRSLEKKARMVRVISEITDHHSVFFINRQKERGTIEGNPIIAIDELMKIGDPEKIVELILKRME